MQGSWRLARSDAMGVMTSTSKENQQKEATLRKLWIVVIACMLFSTLGARTALAEDVVVGVNVVGVDQLSEAQQDALIEQLRRDGVTTVRTGFGPTFQHFITRAYQNGIGTVAILYPMQGSAGLPRPADPAVGLTWRQQALSDANPEVFKEWLVPQLAALEASGVRLTAFELGNEINSPHFNGDFLPAQATGRQLGLSDLTNPNDPEGRAIATGYLKYLKVMATLKDVRDHSKLNRKTPILSAGLASSGPPGKKPGWKLDGVSASDTLAFWRANGIDNLIDGYGMHAYTAPDPNRTVSVLMDVLNKDAFAMCISRKPCWLTEWGFDNRNTSCPVDETTRMKLIETMRGALQQFSAQGRLAGFLYYSWAGHPGEVGSTIFRCGALTNAGKLALSPF
jgi:hypothetical protein